MSIPLPVIDLSSYPVGGSSFVSFNNASPTASVRQYKSPANIQIYNESGSGLQLAFPQSANGYFLPAGGWITLPMAVGEPGYTFTVVYTLPNPPVTQLHTTYYAPGEPVPNVAILGNSPIGIGGTIQTSSVQELVNTGNAPGTPIINVQPSDAASSTWTADNKGNFLVRADNAGVLTQLINFVASAASGNTSVYLGDANHVVEVLGSFTVDGQAYVSGVQVFGSLALQPGSNIALLNGSLTRIGVFAGSNTQTITHNWGVAPDIVIPAYTGNFGTAPANAAFAFGLTTTQFTVHADSGYSWLALAIKG